MTHPDNVPEEISQSITGLNGHDEFADQMVRAGCAVQKMGASLRVYVPEDYTGNDLVALANDIIETGYVIVRFFPQDGGDFWLRLELIPLESSGYIDTFEGEEYGC